MFRAASQRRGGKPRGYPLSIWKEASAAADARRNPTEARWLKISETPLQEVPINPKVGRIRRGKRSHSGSVLGRREKKREGVQERRRDDITG